MIWPGKDGTSLVNNSIPFLTDVTNCNLQGVSWVIPDMRWSDHPIGDTGHPESGPSYVAAIVDAIGNSTCPDKYWQDTAIFITWDDWGGFYDHVPPPVAQRDVQYQNGSNNCPVPTQQWGCGYTYGFRVPLLVVSAYTEAGYVSGALPPYGNGRDAQHTHDFGSILAFIENIFKLGPIDQPYYADFNAIDWVFPNRTNIPLSDFFQWPYKDFVPISPTNSLYNANYFQNYYVNNNLTPMGPDGGDDD